MIIEDILRFIEGVINRADNIDFIFSAIIFILPPLLKKIKIKVVRYYPLIAGFFTYLFAMILINSILTNSSLFEETNFILLILSIICLIEVYYGIKNKKFIEIYELLEEYHFYKKINIDMVKFNYSDNDLERLTFIIRSNFNILSAYIEIGNLNVKIQNKKEYLDFNLIFKFNKNAKDYEIQNIIDRYEELEDIKYINSVKFNQVTNDLEITIREDHH